MSEDTDNDESLIILEQPQTLIVFAANGNLMISQRNGNSTDDIDLFFHPELIPQLIRCLQVKWRDYCEAHDLPLVPDALASLPPLPPLPTPTHSPKKKGGPL